MKKVKRILCLMAALALCLSLCGCSMLDDLRSQRAVYTAEGNILLNGTEYKLLPQCKELTPEFTEYSELYVVESDVPLLLTSMMGDYLDISDDGRFLSAAMYGVIAYYCHTDVYDSVMDRIENGFEPEICAYWSYDYYTGREIPTVLTQQQLDAIRQVQETQEPQILPSGAAMRWDYRIYLFMCSDDLLFRTPTVEIGVTNGTYYVLAETAGEAVFYPVPAELTATFAQITQKYRQLEDAFYNEW